MSKERFPQAHCPQCGSYDFMFAGETTGEPAFWCKDCGTLWYAADARSKPVEINKPKYLAT
jgi:transposase-like protein